jgi:CBS domain-containing protein
MPSVSDILARKGPQVVTIGPEVYVLQAARVMNQHKIGSLLVLDGDQIVGMFTERDVLQRVVVEHRDPATTMVGEVMTVEVACCTSATKIAEARTAMKDRRIRHLPVVDEQGHVLGLISIGDLNAYEATSQEQTIFLLQEYLYGRV